MNFPDPVIRVAIEPKTKAGSEKMGIALAKLAEEDPTFRTWTDEETGQTIIAGMGELHLEIIVDRLLREFKVEANVGAPQVAYRETIRKSANQRPSTRVSPGGKGQYGHVKIKLEPNPGKGYEFVNAVVAARSRRNISPLSTMVSRGAMKAGILAGYPVVDVKVTLWDGSYHEVDSSEMAFSIAGSMAFKEAMKKCDPVIMEPIMKVDVIVPDEYMGNVIGDLNSRRGQIHNQESQDGTARVTAMVPPVRDVRLRHRPALQDPGPWPVLDGARRLPAGPEEHCGQDHDRPRQQGLIHKFYLIFCIESSMIALSKANQNCLN